MSGNGSPPGVPDYVDLAKQTAASNAAATQTQTVANRPNQTDAQGNTSQWIQDPATGAWTQKSMLSGANQGTLDSQNTLGSTLMGQAANAMSNPLNTDGLQTVGDPNALGGGGFDMSATGNSKDIQDATYKLLQPQRLQQREAEVQRLKNQGLTEDSEAFQRGMTRLDQGDTDAQLKSLLAGQDEYSRAFGRASGQNQQNFGQRTQQHSLVSALRGNQLNERRTVRGQPLADIAALRGQTPKPEFAQFATASNPGGTDFLNAGMQQFAGQLGGYNANAAGNANTLGGLAGLFGGLMGAPKGSSGNDLVNWFTGLFG